MTAGDDHGRSFGRRGLGVPRAIEPLPGAAPGATGSPGFLPAGFAPGGAGFRGPNACYAIEDDARATFAADRAADGKAAADGDWRQKLKAYALFAGIAALLLAYVFLANSVHPIRYWDAVAVIAVALAPAEVALAFFVAQDHPLAARNLLAKARAQGLRYWLQALPGWAILGVFLPAAAILWANEAWDRSPPTDETLPVLDTWSRTRKSRTTYYAAVLPVARLPLRFGSFYDNQPVAVPRRAWETLVPGHSTLTLRVHPGRFGLAWYDAAVATTP